MKKKSDIMNEMSVSSQTKVALDLGEKSYNIHIGALAKMGEEFRRLVAGRQVLVVTDKNVEKKCGLEELLEQLSDAAELGVVVLKSGEKHKSLGAVGDICRYAASNNFDRKAIFVAFGGGVTGDMTGFAAAIYKRGIEFIQVPTTLLAMVDSSVGGKCGVDIPEGKNLIGSFHQPKAVFIDPSWLKTLPKKEWSNGLAEIVKYGVIYDKEFFSYLEDNQKRLLKNPNGELYADIIKKCCEIKAEVVAQDEKESGLRAILNYGHTFGHAVELLSNFKLPHGSGVGYGMALAGRLAVKRGEISVEENQRIESLLERLKLPIEAPFKLKSKEVLAAMKGDKKAELGKIKLIMPNAIGQVRVEGGISAEEIGKFLDSEL